MTRGLGYLANPVRVAFRVAGKPEPGGSKRSFGKGRIVDANPRVKSWQGMVAQAAAARMENRELLRGPVVLTAVYTLQRPRNHYRTGRASHLLRDGAPVFPDVRPDLTKLTRAVEDALTGIVWGDDAQVVKQSVTKVYGAPVNAWIQVDAL